MDNKITITTTPHSDGKIVQEVDIAGEIQRYVVDTRDQQIRQSLIALGWMPPDGRE